MCLLRKINFPGKMEELYIYILFTPSHMGYFIRCDSSLPGDGRTRTKASILRMLKQEAMKHLGHCWCFGAAALNLELSVSKFSL